MRHHLLVAIALACATPPAWAASAGAQEAEGPQGSHGPAPRAKRAAFCMPDVTLPKSCKNRAAQPLNASSVEKDVTFIILTPRIKAATEEDFLELALTDSSYIQSGYDPKLDTKIIVHGYMSSAKNFEQMVVAYLTSGSYNIILMDWSRLSKWCYCEHVVKKIASLGSVLTKLLNFLIAKGTDVARVHIIGHSLGAHIAGLGSMAAVQRVGRISGLDPARPGFNDSHERLHKDRADFVDIIHTSAHTFGIAPPIGHIDFYPNGGQSPQPGCSGAAAEVCSHSRAHVLFTESITTDVGYRGIRCENWNLFLEGKCTSENSHTASLGERLNRSSPHGIYYLKTGASCPFYFIQRNSTPSSSLSAINMMTLSFTLLMFWTIKG